MIGKSWLRFAAHGISFGFQHAEPGSILLSPCTKETQPPKLTCFIRPGLFVADLSLFY